MSPLKTWHKSPSIHVPCGACVSEQVIFYLIALPYLYPNFSFFFPLNLFFSDLHMVCNSNKRIISQKIFLCLCLYRTRRNLLRAPLVFWFFLNCGALGCVS